MQGFSKMDSCYLLRHHHYFPEEVIEAILIRLPVKSIIRFQCVRKSWYILIRSASFISKHLIINEETFIVMCFLVRCPRQLDERLLDVCPLQLEERLLAVCPLYDDHKETPGRQLNEGVNGLINLCDSQNQATNHTLPVADSNTICPSFYKSILNLVGHCNGIMCLTYYQIILLVNPSLRQVKRLPDCGLVDNCKLVGFGFDSMTMDFKVIRLLSLMGSWRSYQRTEVYNLRSNEWRKVDEFPLVVIYSSECSPFFNGLVYWCVKAEIFGWRIVTFNMATELFQQMEFPQDWDNRRNSWYENVPSLFVLNQESLAFVSYCHPKSSWSRFVNVWTTSSKQEENVETWTKLYSIGPLNQILKPISFFKKHKILYKTTTGKLILYDLMSHHSSVVCSDLSQVMPYDARFLKLVLEIGECRSSLVSINTT